MTCQTLRGAYPIVVCARIVPTLLPTLGSIASSGELERMVVAFRAGTGGLHSAEN